MIGEQIYWAGFLTSFFIVLMATPSLIKVAKLKHLVDEPSEKRKLHTRSIPTIGGIAIFGSLLFTYALFFPSEYHYIGNSIDISKATIATITLLFFVGVKDDIIGTAPMKKLMAHFVVGFIIVIMFDIRIRSMHGIFGISELDFWQSYLISIFTYIVVVNAYNLIDGLDGLAAGIGIISATSFGLLFGLDQNVPLALLAFTLAGSLLGFLIFNFSPARIFMGDSGSLVIGAVISILVLNGVDLPSDKLPSFFQHVHIPILIISFLIYPLTDTIRAFVLRVIKGKSPFTADKGHIHHLFIKAGFSHSKTVIILYLYTLFTILFTTLFPIKNITLQLLVTIPLALSISLLPIYYIRKQNS